MSAAITVLHLTAHLGGGIGKALSGLVQHTPHDSSIRHIIACLEQPEKTNFLDQIANSGCEVVVAPDHERLVDLIQDSDIVQLEWWGHPTIIAALCKVQLPPMRLLVWCHVSGLNTPVIPRGLMENSHACLFTSPCSYEAAEVRNLPPAIRARLDVIHSCGGFDGLPLPTRPVDDPLKAGYLGSLNFAKLHPNYVNFLAAVPFPGFTVRMVGDIINKETLERKCESAGRAGMLQFGGYTTDVASELAAINIFPYLLNPLHYGTSENALLEAMAMGVVPIVLDNPAERCLVTDQETGLIVGTPREFGDAVAWLANNPQKRQNIGLQAAISVRDRFAAGKMAEAFNHHYESVHGMDKYCISFEAIFGRTPAEWFLSSQRHPELFTPDSKPSAIDEFTLPGLLERSKGSVFHYHKNFPDDPQLDHWAEKLISTLSL